jgi:hypothetical protein
MQHTHDSLLILQAPIPHRSLQVLCKLLQVQRAIQGHHCLRHDISSASELGVLPTEAIGSASDSSFAEGIMQTP